MPILLSIDLQVFPIRHLLQRIEHIVSLLDGLTPLCDYA